VVSVASGEAKVNTWLPFVWELIVFTSPVLTHVIVPFMCVPFVAKVTVKVVVSRGTSPVALSAGSGDV